MRNLRWKLADLLSFVACKLRGQKWYIANCMADVQGNRASELKQDIWEWCVLLHHRHGYERTQILDNIERDLTELGQLAGENWGHWKTKSTIHDKTRI